MGINLSRVENTVETQSSAEHRDNTADASATETILHEDTSCASQMYSIDTVANAVDNDDDFVTFREIMGAVMVGNNQFINTKEESVGRTNNVHNMTQICVCTEDTVFELRQSSCLHRNNNYKGDGFENNNDSEMDVVDNKQNFQTQNTVHSPLKHSDGKVTIIGHTVRVNLNKAGDRIPENNNDLEFELEDVRKLCQTSGIPSVVLEGGGHSMVFEYSGKVEDESYKQGMNACLRNAEFGNADIEGTGSYGSVDEIGIDSTNLINSREIHLDSTSLSEASSLYNSNIDLMETGTNKDAEISCGHSEHSPSHVTVEPLPTDHSHIRNITTETEDDILNDRGTTSSYATMDDSSSVDLDGSVEQFAMAGSYHIISCNSECHSDENESIQELKTLRSDQKTAKSYMRTVTLLTKSTVDVNSAIVDPLEHSNYGSTSENENSFFVSGKFYCHGKSNMKLTKPTRNKKKEPGIT